MLRRWPRASRVDSLRAAEKSSHQAKCGITGKSLLGHCPIDLARARACASVAEKSK
jgi:hypothetical protein